MNRITNTASVLRMPAVVRRFFAAANQFNATRAAECFTPTAIVHDEDRDHNGRKSIFAWVAETTAKFQPTFTLLSAAIVGETVKMNVAIAGRFPGSPVTLGFEFRLRGNKISTLTIV